MGAPAHKEMPDADLHRASLSFPHPLSYFLYRALVFFKFCATRYFTILLMRS